MKIFLNELSLDGQFCNQEDFENKIKKISEILWYFRGYNVLIYASSLLWNRMALRKNNLSQSLNMIRDRDIRSLFLGLVAKSTFWEDEKIHKKESLYYYEDQKITGFTPAEAAERIYSKQEKCSLISFEGAMELNFSEKECEIIRKIGDRNTDIKIIVFNITNKLHAREWYDSNIKSNNWDDFLNKTTLRCSNLRFLPKIKRDLKSIIHSAELADTFLKELIKLNDRLFQLINKKEFDSTSLEEYMQKAGLDVGDESESTKSNRKLMKIRTFSLPDGREIEFPLHIKIKHKNQHPRIHFFIEEIENNNIIWIGYIGKHLPTSSRKK
ncbi:MAG: hypothetical protein K8T10_09740 [Candidatus Eremiobacteraeota bacterium]|nr:hypothetical protein [Candidatus Eremiobacteraeota bacterium]